MTGVDESAPPWDTSLELRKKGSYYGRVMCWFSDDISHEIFRQNLEKCSPFFQQPRSRNTPNTLLFQHFHILQIISIRRLHKKIRSATINPYDLKKIRMCPSPRRSKFGKSEEIFIIRKSNLRVFR